MKKIKTKLLRIGAAPDYEDFTAYTEVDIPADRLSITETRITVTGLLDDEDVRVHDDKGVDHFNEDFEHLVTVRASDTYGKFLGVWALTNDELCSYPLETGNKAHLIVLFWNSLDTPLIYLREFYDSSSNQQSYGCSENTTYYLRIKRDEAIGDFGRLYCDIYTSEADRTNEENAVANLQVDLRAKLDFRYVYGMTGWNFTAATNAKSAYIENLSLQE